MRVHVARLGLDPQQDEPAERFERLARIDRFGEHSVSADPDAADIFFSLSATCSWPIGN
jgi:hypothetical protein